MKSSEGNITPVGTPPDGKDGLTGLRGPRTWRAVYALVLAVFALWVGLLIALTVSFS